MYDYQSTYAGYTGSGLQELDDIAIQADAVEFYHHSGVVSEYKCGFCTVRSSDIG